MTNKELAAALLLLDEKLLKMETEVGLMDGLPIRAE